jgi:hypothetical protein
MDHKTYNTHIDDQGICWITDGDRMLRVGTDLFVRYSYQAYHDCGFPTTEEGRRAAEQATARALFRHLRRSGGDGEQVA